MDTLLWEEKDVFNPAVVLRNDTIVMIYRAEDTIGKHAGTSRLGYAYSLDGIHFTKKNHPVLFPDNDSLKIYEWEGGIEDPRIVSTESGAYIMTYTAYDGVLARLMVATSDDLIHWEKQGPAFQGKYKNQWSKSGAIVTQQKGERFVATKINGKYYMYYGDTDLFLATSTDLIRWTPEVQPNGELVSALKPRAKYFDSRLVESGPFAIVRPEGILLIYNGMNLPEANPDKSVKQPADSYAGGQALFDATNPSKCIQQLDKPFIIPDQPFELEGQVNQVVFLEGLVQFKGKWFLYYGTADSKIAVAIQP